MSKIVNGDAHKKSDFLYKLVNLLEDSGVLDTAARKEVPVINFQHPAKLQNILSLELVDESLPDKKLLALCQDVVHYSVKTGHPHFHNQLYGGVDLYSLAGTWLTEALNTSQYTYEVAPAFTLIEDAVLKHVLKLVGYDDGDGLFAPGGSMSNMYGMVLARYCKIPDVKTKGLSGLPPLVAFVSEDSHYSIVKSAHWLGIGTDNVVKVKTDDIGRMIPEELDKAIEKVKAIGITPLIVVATAGTTVLGTFDPLDRISDICEKHKIWLHVDACLGGTLLLSKKYSHYLKGLDRSDSVSWNPHKLLGAPLQCSLFLIKQKGLLHHCNCASATYLFQQDKFYDMSYDTGDKSVQCGRKIDSFKLWLMWKAHGNSGLERLVDNAVDCSRYFRDRITQQPGFRLVTNEIQCTNVCFWYIPPNLRNQTEDDDWWSRINKVAPAIKEKLVYAGTLMIGYQPLSHKGYCNFFRAVTTCHPSPTPSDMDYIIEQIEDHGKNLSI